MTHLIKTKVLTAALAGVLGFGLLAGGYASAANAKVLKAPVNTGILKIAPLPGPPRFLFSIDSFTIKDTRALHKDTDYVTVGVNDQPNQVKAMGNLNNGTYAVGITFNVGVAADRTETFSYLIVNTAKSPGSVSAFLQQVALDVGQNFGLNLTGLLTGGCDGLVAKGQHSFTGAELVAQTAGGKVIAGNDYTPGTDSATGCGSNSRYYVKWSISAAP